MCYHLCFRLLFPKNGHEADILTDFYGGKCIMPDQFDYIPNIPSTLSDHVYVACIFEAALLAANPSRIATVRHGTETST
jgi:hypothetical protein